MLPTTRPLTAPGELRTGGVHVPGLSPAIVPRDGLGGVVAFSMLGRPLRTRRERRYEPRTSGSGFRVGGPGCPRDYQLEVVEDAHGTHVRAKGFTERG